MTFRYFLLSFLVILVSCKHETGFVNYEKWQPLIAKDGMLKGHPREIKAINYYTLKDTTLFGQDKVGGSSIDKFDSEGNLIYNSTIVDSLMRSEAFRQYSDDGVQYRSCIYRAQRMDSCEVRTIQKSKRISANSFMTTSYRNGTKEYDELYIFEPDKVTRERTFETGKKKTFILWYKDGRLIKTEIKDNPSVVTTYYRNKNGILDSTRTDYYKEIFINNKQGDPVEYYEMRGKDTITYERYKYEYDSKENWVRRLTYSKKESANMFSNNKFPEYSLDVREIKY